MLFNETLGYNVKYGAQDLNASDEEVMEALRAARLENMVKHHWRDGTDTLVGERGLKLSGGEKQRVSIARAILKDAPILFCDEATSALDAETEAEVMEDLFQAAKGRTSLLIAHRLSTVRHADLIVVLDGGRVVEQGTHSDLLLRPNGKYSELWAMQHNEGDAEAEGTGPVIK